MPRARLAGRTIPTLLVVALAGVLAILSTARPGDPALYPAGPEPGVVVYLVRNPYHAELALPSDLLLRGGGGSAKAARRLAPSPWVMIGWGDARFYRGRGWSLERAAQAVSAALPPSNPSALRLTPLSRAPDHAFEGGVLRLELSQEGARRLLRRLDRSFRVRAGEPVELRPETDHGEARFFESVEGFGPPRLCNNWTGDMLAAAGVPTTPMLHLTPQGLMLDLGWRAAGAAPDRPQARRRRAPSPARSSRSAARRRRSAGRARPCGCA